MTDMSIADAAPLCQPKGDMIEGIIFDKDGTLFDFRRSWGGWAQGFLRGIARDAAHADAMGHAIGFDLANATFAPDSPVIAATAADIALVLAPHLPGQSPASITQSINAAAAQAPMVQAVPLRPLLTALRDRGLRIGLATNDTEVPARAHLAAHGITAFFDYIAGYDSGHGAKPGPGMCAAFANAFALDPGRVVMVGDSLHDLHAGRSAGMICVGVLTGMATAADLGPHADAVLPDIGALPGWLDSRNVQKTT
jgi:phosphoglycolate phosphatase